MESRLDRLKDIQTPLLPLSFYQTGYMSYQVAVMGQLNFGISLVKDMETVLNQFIKAGEKSELMRNTLEITLDKNRVIFDREIKKLSEQEV